MPKYNVSTAMVEVEADSPEAAFEKFCKDPDLRRVILVEDADQGPQRDFSDVHEFVLS